MQNCQDTGENASCDVCILVGNPISHSLSPVIHRTAYEVLGLSWEYTLHPCLFEHDVLLAFEQLRAQKLIGINVTTPYKNLAMRACDKLDETARISGNVNVLSIEDGFLVGRCTDGAGVVASFAREGGLAVAGESFLVCGTGPTAASAITALCDAGAAQVYCMSRSLERAKSLVCLLEKRYNTKLSSRTYEDIEQVLACVQGVMNATTVGMRPNDPSLFPVEFLSANHVVIDAIYAHKTALVTGATKQGARAYDGLGMLVEQAALTIEIWMQSQGIAYESIPRAVLRQAAVSALHRRAN